MADGSYCRQTRGVGCRRSFSSRSSSVDGWGDRFLSIAINPGTVHAGISRHTRGVGASVSVSESRVSFLFVRSDRDRHACGIMNVRHSTPSMLSSSNDVSRVSSRLYSLQLQRKQGCSTARSVARLSSLSCRTSMHQSSDQLNEQLLVGWACVGIIDESVLECCARVHLWAWINAHTDCFERMNHAASGLDSLQGDDADTEFN